MNGTIEQLRVRARGPNPLVSWSDESLLLSYRSQRDAGVFEELVCRYEKDLYGYLRHYLGDAEMAEDVFHAIKRGDLKLGQPERFPLADAKKVHTALESRATTGSIVLIP